MENKDFIEVINEDNLNSINYIEKKLKISNK